MRSTLAMQYEFSCTNIRNKVTIYIGPTDIGALSAKICPHKSVLTNLFSKFDEFLAALSQFDTDHRVDFLRIHVANPRPLDRFLRYIVIFFYENFF